MSGRVMQWWHCLHPCQMHCGSSAHKVTILLKCLAASTHIASCCALGPRSRMWQLPSPVTGCGAGARGSILLERSADSGACSTERTAPLNDVLEQLWQELDQCSRAESGCCTADGAQIGFDGQQLTMSRRNM
jgi:hypothetical protein